jgi:hypothetical protein
VPNWSISRNYKNIWNSTKYTITTGIFVTRRPRGAKPQVKGAQGSSGRPNPLAGRSHFESVQAKTWWLRSYVGSQEYPMPKSWWKLGGLASQPHGPAWVIVVLALCNPPRQGHGEPAKFGMMYPLVWTLCCDTVSEKPGSRSRVGSITSDLESWIMCCDR